GNPSDCGFYTTCSATGVCTPGLCDDATNPCIYGYTCFPDGSCRQTDQNQCEGPTHDDCGVGLLCIAGNGTGGQCLRPAQQCFDRAQCAPDERCVEGVCTLACTSSADCRDGYVCNTRTKFCVNFNLCDRTPDCRSPLEVCVGKVCIARSNGA